MSLPNDIIFNILLHVPAESVIRFKCVCKSWYALFKDRNFILAHTKTLSLRSRNDARLLICCRENSTNKRVISMSIDSLLSKFINQDLPPFLSNTFGQIRLVGPCHGIVCLYGYPDNIVLYNPLLRQFKILPKSLIPRPQDAKVRGGDVGLGFDSFKNDYKVIQILFCITSHHRLEYIIEIYSLNMDSWKKYEANVHANIMYTNIWSMVYKNETFCWWAKNGDSNEVILSFHMCNETFQETPFPCDIENIGGPHGITRAILPYNDSIALVVYSSKEVDKFFDIWVMRGLGVGEAEETWRKVSRIGPISGVLRPLGFWKNDEMMLENCCRELVVYDHDMGVVKNLGLYGKRDRLEVLVYIGTLVKFNPT